MAITIVAGNYLLKSCDFSLFESNFSLAQSLLDIPIIPIQAEKWVIHLHSEEHLEYFSVNYTNIWKDFIR